MASLDFDPNEFNVPSVDNKGHSERLTVRMPPGYLRELEVIMNSKMLPYGSKGDIIRHGIKRHLNYVRGLAPFPSVFAQTLAIEEIVREEEFYQQFVSTFDSLNSAVSQAIGQGEPKRATALIAKVKAKINDMPEGPWRDKWLKRLKADFGHVSEGKSLTLVPDNSGE